MPLLLLLLRSLLVLLSSSTLSLALYSLIGEHCASTCGAAVSQQKVWAMRLSAEGNGSPTEAGSHFKRLKWPRLTAMPHLGA